MKEILLFTFLLIFTFQIKAQNYNLPPNPKPGKCYERLFDYNKKFEWKEISCDKILILKTKLTKKEQVKCLQEKVKMEKYQEKLKSLGYNVDLTGIADDKTIIAHHKYLKKKKREQRKKLKSEKKRQLN